jgi:eukaryotic-like serine/threonine-protein kinase
MRRARASGTLSIGGHVIGSRLVRRKEEQSTVKQAAPLPAKTAKQVDAVSRPEIVFGKMLGRYELCFEIARGGMGVVYAARSRGERGVERRVAIKTLPRKNTDPDAFESFVSEARITARLNHPNIVDTFELCLDADEPYIVMRLIEGISLADLLYDAKARGEPLDPGMALYIVRQIATGLHAAHELSTSDSFGLVHRDVSPQNILLSYDGRIYLADFGVAKLSGRGHSTAHGVIKGKFSYMSPEQARAERLDRRSDIFSLGAVLYQSLTLIEPFASDSPAGAVFRVLNEEPRSPSSARSQIDASVSEIVMRCLEKSKEARTASADLLADEIRECLRAHKELIDEKDVARLIEDRFPQHRRDFDARFTRAGMNPIVTGADKRSAADEPPQVESMSHTVARLPGLEPKRWIIRGVLVAGAIAAMVALFYLTRPKPSPSVDIATSTSSAAMEERPQVVASSLPNAPQDSAVSNTSPTVEAPTAKAPVRAEKPKTTATASATQAPSVAPTSHRGQPFRQLP